MTSVTQLPAAGSALAPGARTVTLTAMDAFGHSANTAFSVTMLSFSNDTDGDGMNDASEVQMSTLGFNWQVGQAALVSTYKSSANGAGYFTPAQVQALNVGATLLARDAASGQFTLDLGLEKSTDLQTFTLFPFLAPQTSVQPNGHLRFQFTVPDNAAFFRIERK